MYPYKLFGDFDLYMICILIGAVGCLVLVRKLADRLALSDRLTNLVLASGIFGMAVGYGSAVLFQAFYDFLKTGVFQIGGDTGATFYGGLIGGAAGFLLLYFIGGRFFCPGEAVPAFFTVSGMAACGITLAHACGRIGCFMVGCCYGATTDAWYGIYMPARGARVIPTQLYEAVFLLLLTVLFVFLVLRRRHGVLAFYMIAYGVFRFLIEFWRADDRGASFLSFLSPSQFTALLMILGGGALFLLESLLVRRSLAKTEEV